jgi:hypothetical protein
MRLSACGRFVVLETLHIDRKVLESLASWAAERGLRVQDAIQLAICAFNEAGGERASNRCHLRAGRAPASSPRMRTGPPQVDRS